MNNERHILQLFARGDSRAMDVLYAEFADYMAGVCVRYVTQPDDIRDVLQEALIKVFSSVGTFKYLGEGSLKAWLTRVVVNEALMFLREKKKMLFVDSERDIPDAPDEPPDTSGLTADMVDEALRQLPDGYRAVFNLYAIEGKSHKEIAELLGIKPDTSASQYHRAKAMLARLLSKRKKETQ